ncbi:MAG: hypothetical protein KF773_22695 [Deltaproteobacteria bacterium]|nr:hypothetical protein [Deltaproteobacteria bacterium]MCW5807384.1 hypothetical protein [Deltaproteobacteria bacterium]
MLCLLFFIGFAFTGTAGADAPVPDQAINCQKGGCIADGPGCDTKAVPGQCSFPRARAEELCRNHPQCIAVNCNTARRDCQARDTRTLAPWVGMTSIVVRKHPKPVKDQAINCAKSGCIADGPGCDTKAVPGQCSFPRATAVELCFKHPQCIAVNCNSARGDCQARDTRKRDPWAGMDSIILDKD